MLLGGGKMADCKEGGCMDLVERLAVRRDMFPLGGMVTGSTDEKFCGFFPLGG